MPSPKKRKQTGAIFANVQAVHEQAAQEPQTLRRSLDSKATVRIGPFSRGGNRRLGSAGVDHDFKPEGCLTPLGIFRPQTAVSPLVFTDSKVSSDFMEDRLEQWLTEQGAPLREMRQLVLDLDNGPENSGQRSQWLFRLVLLAQRFPWQIVLVFYPPYPSKYNPIERLGGCWRTTGVGSCWTARLRSWATRQTGPTAECLRK